MVKFFRKSSDNYDISDETRDRVRVLGNLDGKRFEIRASVQDREAFI